MNYIAFDCHRRYTFARVEDASGRRLWEGRIPHRRGIFLEFLEGFEPSTPRALETIGSWCWVVDEIEARGLRPRLVGDPAKDRHFPLTLLCTKCFKVSQFKIPPDIAVPSISHR